jgi:hypothetical protein
VRLSTRRHVAPSFPYRLAVSAAGPDDTAPGVWLPNHESVAGHLDGVGVDRLDLYRFTARHRSVLHAAVAIPVSRAVDLELRSDDGTRLECSCESNGPQSFSRQVAPGRYYIVVRSRSARGVAYRLLRLAREVTTTRTLVDGTTAATAGPGRTVRLEARVTPAPAGGHVRFMLQRLDPVASWQFIRLDDVPVGGSGIAGLTIVPPSVGRYRVVASYGGTLSSAPSRGGWAHLLVWEPLLT